MPEIHCIADADTISDPAERIFAVALVQAFPTISLFQSATITAYAGKRPRTTVADFMLTDRQGQSIYVEIASGDKVTGRKAKQHKTARLAGLGSRHITFYGSEISSLQHPDIAIVRAQLLSLITQRIDRKYFDFSE